MPRRWGVLLAMLALTAGTALTASSASAATIRAGGFRPGGPMHLVGGSRGLRGAISHQADSTNWSGFAATAGPYASVSASWVQPAGTCSSADQYAAFWVGLDGYSSRTVEQTGSEVNCIGGTAEYYAWYELYPGPSEDYASTVQVGDHFTATVTYLGSSQFSLYIADTTQGWSHTATASVSGAAHSSAEVIAEAPCCAAGGRILPLTDFGTMSFAGSAANGGALGNAGGVTQIIMIDNAGRDRDAVSALSGEENFGVTWLQSG